jgi:uncharacterized protein YgiB involved in biofilm formation
MKPRTLQSGWHNQKENETSKESSVSAFQLLLAGFVLGLSINPESKGDMSDFF